MPTVTDHRLPGVTYEVVPPQLPDTLPRMDVAGFVGFASAGPVDVPVVVDDVAVFRDVFGPDVALARDARSGAWIHSHLGAAVEEFLRNGGRRCWVVRVASRDIEVARFPAAGLLGLVDPAGGVRAAELAGRAAGDWADGLRVATALGGQRLPPVELVAGQPHLRIAARTSLAPGDLLRMTIGDGASTELLVVAEVTVGTDGVTTVAWDGRLALEPDRAADPVTGAATVVTVAGEEPLGLRTAEMDPSDEADAAPRDRPRHRVVDASPADAPVGSLVRLVVDGRSLVAPVRGAAPGGDRVVVGPCSWVVGTPVVPPHVLRSKRDDDTSEGDGSEEDAPVGELHLEVPDSTSVVVEQLSLTLAVYEGERLRARIDGLAFDARHPQHWAALPSDDALFLTQARQAGADGRGPRPTGTSDARLPALWGRVTRPRFPLAAPGGAAETWFPVAVPDLATPDAALPTVSPVGRDDRRRRSGLATFDPSVFTDPALVRVPADGLAAEVSARASLAPPPPFRGMHALFPIDEVTLVAVPDASHPSWRIRREALELPPDAPALRAPIVDGDAVHLWWTHVATAERYVLEEAATLDVAEPRVRLDGPAPQSDGPDGTVGVGLPSTACPTRRVFRVRAVSAAGRSSPWSNTVHVIDPTTVFAGADEAHLPAPEVTLVANPDDASTTQRLRWTAPDEPELPAGARAEVVRSTDPLFATAHQVDHGGADHLDLQPAGDDHSFFCVRYLDDTGRAGPWSVTVAKPARDRELLEIVDPLAGELSAPLLDVQQALVRLTAGRGDVLALLSLPVAYREHETLAHLAQLGRLHASSAAVFAPWTTIRSGVGVRAVPPDGAVAGVIAHRTIERGAWISPGNQPLAGVVALGTELAAADTGALTAAGANLLVRRPAGVVAVSAATLDDDATTRPIEVRRLLHLLRRLALRHGATFVFEPNGHRFRSKVRRTFQRALGELYERGAFAGAHPDEGFRVVADHTVNPPASLDAGRFVIELRIAPTQPMAFIRVRLVQTGPGDPIAVEVLP